jgi:FAD binding domain
METFDVIQVGYGPVGQAMAALLGRRGHRVAVFDRHARRYGLPRVGGVDHEIMRILQSLGVKCPSGAVAFSPLPLSGLLGLAPRYCRCQLAGHIPRMPATSIRRPQPRWPAPPLPVPPRAAGLDGVRLSPAKHGLAVTMYARGQQQIRHPPDAPGALLTRAWMRSPATPPGREARRSLPGGMAAAARPADTGQSMTVPGGGPVPPAGTGPYEGHRAIAGTRLGLGQFSNKTGPCR